MHTLRVDENRCLRLFIDLVNLSSKLHQICTNYLVVVLTTTFRTPEGVMRRDCLWKFFARRRSHELGMVPCRHIAVKPVLWSAARLGRPSTEQSKRKIRGHDQTTCTVAGLVRIADRRRSVWARGFWTFLMASCLLLSLELAHERIKYFLSEPILVNTEAKVNKSMIFPVVTLCHRGSVGDVFANQSEFGADIIHSKIIKCVIERNKNCSQVGFWRPILTVLGVCYEFELGYDVNISGSYHGLLIEMKIAHNGVKVWIHDRRASPQIDVELRGLSVFHGNFVDIVVEFKQVLRKNKRGFPCEEDANYSSSHCIVGCWMDHFETVAECGLPRFDVALKESQIHNCSSSDRRRIKLTIQNEMELGEWKPSECDRCPAACKMRSYDTRSQVYELKSDRTTVIRIFYDDMNYQILRESPAYTFMALACDIGGSFGFCLGISIPTIVELVEILAVFIKRKIKI